MEGRSEGERVREGEWEREREMEGRSVEERVREGEREREGRKGLKPSYQLSGDWNLVEVAVSFLQLLIDHKLHCTMRRAY